MNASKTEIIDCPKCDGKGIIRAFGHYASGVCFECGGKGRFEITAATPAQIAQAARNNAHAAAIRSLALKIGISQNGKTYLPVGELVVGCHTEDSVYRMQAPAGSFSASPKGRKLASIYAEAVAIVDAAVEARMVGRRQVARLQTLAEELAAVSA